MVKYNYPQYIQHKKEHDDLTIQLKDFKASLIPEQLVCRFSL
jgi:hemerythrin